MFLFSHAYVASLGLSLCQETPYALQENKNLPGIGLVLLVLLRDEGGIDSGRLGLVIVERVLDEVRVCHVNYSRIRLGILPDKGYVVLFAKAISASHCS